MRQAVRSEGARWVVRWGSVNNNKCVSVCSAQLFWTHAKAGHAARQASIAFMMLTLLERTQSRAVVLGLLARLRSRSMMVLHVV